MTKRYFVTIKEEKTISSDPVYSITNPTIFFKFERNNTKTIYSIICSDENKINALAEYIKDFWKKDTKIRKKEFK